MVISFIQNMQLMFQTQTNVRPIHACMAGHVQMGRTTIVVNALLDILVATAEIVRNT